MYECSIGDGVIYGMKKGWWRLSCTWQQHLLSFFTSTIGTSISIPLLQNLIPCQNTFVPANRRWSPKARDYICAVHRSCMPRKARSHGLRCYVVGSNYLRSQATLPGQPLAFAINCFLSLANLKRLHAWIFKAYQPTTSKYSKTRQQYRQHTWRLRTQLIESCLSGGPSTALSESYWYQRLSLYAFLTAFSQPL